MTQNLNMLITNDDGYNSKGIRVLADMMRQFGRVTVIAPKFHQSGMSTAVNIGPKALAWKRLDNEFGPGWSYFNATPASCVKFALDMRMADDRPDGVLSGINHGSNASTAVNYSGTVGAAEEAAINGIPGIGVSLDSMDPQADFSAVAAIFPDIFRDLMENLPANRSVFYNVNFPKLPQAEIKGVRIGHQGIGHWVRQIEPWNVEFFRKRGYDPEKMGLSQNPPKEEGEELFMMLGQFADDTPAEDRRADHHILEDGCVAVVPHTFDRSDYAEYERLASLNLDKEF